MDDTIDIAGVPEITCTDEMMLWTLGGVSQRRAWTSPDRTAAVVAGAARSGRDRLGLRGEIDSVVPLERDRITS